MFPRRQRLSRAIFPSILKEGRRFSSPNLSILIFEGLEGYAVVVSKKIARLSVTRHRIKRRILAALQNFPFTLPNSLIVFPKSSASTVSYQDIRVELIELLSRK